MLEDTVFVTGMNKETTEEEIASYFGAIGVVKVRYTTHIFNLVVLSY